MYTKFSHEYELVNEIRVEFFRFGSKLFTLPGQRSELNAGQISSVTKTDKLIF